MARRAKMIKRAVLGIVFVAAFSGASAFGAGPCPAGSSRLACVIPLEYGIGPNGEPFSASNQGVFASQEHEGHFDNSIGKVLGPVTADIGRQSNLLPLASPSSGIIYTYDTSLKTVVLVTDSLGPILGERAETVGRHRIFVGFSYQFFNFNKIDSVDLHNFPVMLVHADDNVDNSLPPPAAPTVCSAAVTATKNLNGCAFVRDLISTVNSIDLKVNQYTTYVTFGLTSHIDLSMVIPVENVRMSLRSDDTIILGSNGFYTATPGTPDSATQQPRFNHLWGNCPVPKPAIGASGLDPSCLNHVFPDPTGLAQGGSSGSNSVTGIGDVVARVKWNVWHGERAGVAAGVDVRLPTGDELNYLGSGTYGVKPFGIFSYRARVSPHVLVGYEWNGKSITAGDFATGTKARVPNDFVYSAGADASITKWLTASFDVIGQRISSTSTTIGGNVFGTQSLSVVSQPFLAPCGACAANPNPATVAHNNLQLGSPRSYNITNASMGVKFRPLGKLSKLVVTANVLVRLDEGGLSYKPVPLIGFGYTF
jgi:hypothetical protein